QARAAWIVVEVLRIRTLVEVGGGALYGIDRLWGAAEVRAHDMTKQGYVSLTPIEVRGDGRRSLDELAPHAGIEAANDLRPHHAHGAAPAVELLPQPPH